MDFHKRLFIRFSLVLFVVFTVFPAFSVSAKDPSGDTFSPTDLILHHVLDDHSWHLFDTPDGTKYSIPLPVILFTEGRLDIFLSSAFHHGTQTVVRGDREYKLDHGHIEELSGKRVLDFSITKNVASMMLSVILLFWVFSAVASAYKKRQGKAPKGIQSLFEPLIVYLRDDVAIPNIGEKKYARYFPFLLSLFFFIWFNNLLGLIPTGANASGNIAFTLTLALFTLIVTNVSGNANYWKHIFWTPGIPLLLRIIMLPVELIGILTKPFALMVRLFANITAGHIIILSLVSIIFIFKNGFLIFGVGPAVVALMFLELFVAILQAYIFTLLSALFIGIAVAEDHH